MRPVPPVCPHGILTKPEQLAVVGRQRFDRLDTTTNGIEATISGADPYIIGPARNYPSGQALRVCASAPAQGGPAVVLLPHHAHR